MKMMAQQNQNMLQLISKLITKSAFLIGLTVVFVN